MKYSVIVPTFKRRDEVGELLESLIMSSFKDFEIILADGTPDKSLCDMVDSYRDRIAINHLHRPYLGISESRNLGAAHAQGQYVLFFDSDCVIPNDYFEKVNRFIQAENPDAFGGPDAAADNFTPVQKAISHTMTSMLTTGGIRGKKSHAGGRFYPRSFNMGIKKDVFEKVNGFALLKVSEDIDLSIRMYKAGYKVCLVPEAHVFHKRRTDFKQFFKQVFRFGAGRINIGRLHKGELKLAHTIPAFFLAYLLFIPVSVLIHNNLPFVLLALLAIYLFGLFMESLVANKSIKVALLSLISLFVQFAGYGSGFLINFWKVKVQKKEPVVL
jgi:cellulose synthase/poly-beta-1,6-N-acetylglucosamine synthase-like glycosyltransferase